MGGPAVANADVCRRAKEIYAQTLRAKLEPQQNGQLIALDVDSGDYEIADRAGAAVERLRKRRATANVFILRVGAPTAFRLGYHARAGQS